MANSAVVVAASRRGSPKLVKLEVVHQPPVLVGEWYPLLLSMENLENESALSLTVSAWLRDAADPLVV